ncbi:MAG: hypothetical protein J6Y43_06745 [Clostridia bacterium]|nr:hypothetical protein [Clostridia bacterium]
MKKLLALILALVAVFCMFTGCSDGKVDDDKGNTDITDTTENGENTGDNVDEDNKPEYTIVTPITDGGSFDGGNYK